MVRNNSIGILNLVDWKSHIHHSLIVDDSVRSVSQSAYHGKSIVLIIFTHVQLWNFWIVSIQCYRFYCNNDYYFIDLWSNLICLQKNLSIWLEFSCTHSIIINYSQLLPIVVSVSSSWNYKKLSQLHFSELDIAYRWPILSNNK